MNPNSNAATTRAMVTIAARTLRHVQGWTAPDGPGLLMTMDLLATAAEQVAGAEIPAGIDGVIVSAFGDPGRADLAARLAVPVVGIGESAALAAAKGGRRYAVVTHTPGLVDGIDALMRASAPGGAYLGTFLASGDALALAADAQALDTALLAAARRAHAAGAEAVIIGGGPLGEAAERLRPQAPCALVAPIPEAARRLLSLLQDIS
ncbi:aspartate/glutamate racemase family protein [Puniceibacterium sediminis]|nr:aspartate/glutamate racemase family protein [Puniceibacterium sediminis]